MVALKTLKSLASKDTNYLIIIQPIRGQYMSHIQARNVIKGTGPINYLHLHSERNLLREVSSGLAGLQVLKVGHGTAEFEKNWFWL